MSSLSIETAATCIRQKGVFWTAYDGNEGEPLRKLYHSRFPLRTPEGLEFCAERTLLRTDIRTVVELFIDRPRLGFVKVYGDKLPTDSAYFFQAGSGTSLIVIQLWAPDSVVIWHEGRYLDSKNIYDLAEEDSGTGLFKSPRETLRQHPDFRENIQELSSGALAITDGRLGFTILNGWTLCLGFATDTPWKMKVEASEEMRAKVADLEARGFAMNITFDDQ